MAAETPTTSTELYNPSNDPKRKAKSTDVGRKYGFWPDLNKKDMVQCILCGRVMEHSQLYDHNLSNKMPKEEVCFCADIMENILSRLPSTSLARFQTVSKYWCTVIRLFVSNADSKSSLMRVQLSPILGSGGIRCVNFNEEGKNIDSTHKLNIPWEFKLSNMVNGLACAYGYETTTNFYLVNLTTFKTSKHAKRKINGINYDRITLGWDPSASLYKFIRIYSHKKSSSYHCEILEIGFLYEGTWKIVGEIPYKVDLENPVFLNGAVYWKMNPKSNTHPFDLLKMDMKNEKFETVTLAIRDEVDRCNYNEFCDWGYSFTLCEEDGKLYMLHYCCERKYLSGWRLREKEGSCVWNNVFHVDFASMAIKESDCLLYRREEPYVVGIVDGKVLVCRNGKGAYIYDLVHKKLTKHWDVGGRRCCHTRKIMLLRL